MKDAKGHGSDAHVMSGGAAFAVGKGEHIFRAKQAEAAAHQEGVEKATTPFWGTAKVGNKYVDTGPHPSREQARDAARAMLKGRAAMRGGVSTGYGKVGPHFDIRFHNRFE